MLTAKADKMLDVLPRSALAYDIPGATMDEANGLISVIELTSTKTVAFFFELQFLSY
jgi:hypothetical protein